MIVRHSETTKHFEPSVKFYRTIALSFIFITVVLLGLVIFITSKKAIITILAKEDLETANVNAIVSAQDAVGNVSGVVTTTEFIWKQTYFPTTFNSSEAIATGEVVIYNKGNTDQILIKTTRLLTPDNILFRLTDRVNVPANGQVVARVYADQTGLAGETEPTSFTIPGLSVDQQKIIYAQSKLAIKGGASKVGILTVADLESAETKYKEQVSEAFASQAVAPSDGMSLVVRVLSSETVSDHNVGETIDDFELSGKSKVVAVWYDNRELKALVVREIGNKVDLELEKVLSVFGDPKVTLVAQDLNKLTAQLTVHQEARVTLDPDAAKISAWQFIDKTKEEIERYLLGLKHVNAAEVKFSPSWMHKSPSVPDNIKVIVKQVE